MIKESMLEICKFLLNLSFFIVILIEMVLTILIMSTNYLNGIICFLISILVAIVVFFPMFLLVDIHDTIKKDN